MDKNKLNLKSLFNSRKFKYGTYATIVTLVGIALIMLLNAGLSALEENFDLKIDTSQSQLYTLSDQTKNILNKLDQDIYIYTVYNEGQEDQNTQELLKKYRGVSGHIIVENKDPDLDPRFIEQFAATGETISLGSVVVANKDNTLYRAMDAYDIYQATSDTSGNVSVTQFKAESAVTAAINYVVTGYMPTAWLVQGHGELSLAQFAAVQNTMSRDNYNVESVNIAQTPEKIKAGDIIMFINPTSDITDDERELLKPMMEQGGRFLFLMDPVELDSKTLPNLESLLMLYNVELKRGLIVEGDVGYTISNAPVYLVPDLQSHAITNTLTTGNTPPVIVPLGGAIKLPEEAPEVTMTITPLMLTSSQSYLKTGEVASGGTIAKEEGDETGPFVLAAAIEKADPTNEENNARIVVVYNYMFAVDTNYTAYTSNIDFFLNAAAWMRNSTDDIYIRPKALTNPVLIMQSQGQLLSVIVVSTLLVPIVMLVLGIVVYIRRKNL